MLGLVINVGVAILLYIMAIVLLLSGEYVWVDVTVFEGLSLYLLAAAFLSMGILALMMANAWYQSTQIMGSIHDAAESTGSLLRRYWPLTVLSVALMMAAFSSAQKLMQYETVTYSYYTQPSAHLAYLGRDKQTLASPSQNESRKDVIKSHRLNN